MSLDSHYSIFPGKCSAVYIQSLFSFRWGGTKRIWILQKIYQSTERTPTAKVWGQSRGQRGPPRGQNLTQNIPVTCILFVLLIFENFGYVSKLGAKLEWTVTSFLKRQLLYYLKSHWYMYSSMYLHVIYVVIHWLNTLCVVFKRLFWIFLFK